MKNMSLSLIHGGKINAGFQNKLNFIIKPINIFMTIERLLFSKEYYKFYANKKSNFF